METRRVYYVQQKVCRVILSWPSTAKRITVVVPKPIGVETGETVIDVTNAKPGFSLVARRSAS